MEKNAIRLTGVMYVSELADTLLSMIEHGYRSKCSFVVKDRRAHLGFLTFMLQASMHKEITLTAIALDDQHATVDYNNVEARISDPDRVLIKILHPDAVIPTHKSLGAEGYDLYSTDSAVIPPGEK
eukprot:9882237-Ditylum_brightwellii.AAC.1